jgi:hypothetical protein
MAYFGKAFGQDVHDYSRRVYEYQLLALLVPGNVFPPQPRTSGGRFPSHRGLVEIEGGDGHTGHADSPTCAVVDESGRKSVEKGRFRLTVGGASPGARAAALGAPEPAVAEVTVE